MNEPAEVFAAGAMLAELHTALARGETGDLAELVWAELEVQLGINGHADSLVDLLVGGTPRPVMPRGSRRSDTDYPHNTDERVLVSLNCYVTK